jgi:hypothetical protein
MQFSRLDNFLVASRITGPHHNLLQLRLGKGVVSSPVLDCLPAVGNCTHAPIDPARLMASVIEGVFLANQELGTDYVATHIRYVSNDTPPETTYGFLALAIVRHLESGGAFTSA